MYNITKAYDGFTSAIKDILGLNPNHGPVSAQPKPEIVDRLPGGAIQITPAKVGYKVPETGDLYLRIAEGFAVLRNERFVNNSEERTPKTDLGNLVLSGANA